MGGGGGWSVGGGGWGWGGGVGRGGGGWGGGGGGRGWGGGGLRGGGGCRRTTKTKTKKNKKTKKKKKKKKKKNKKNNKKNKKKKTKTLAREHHRSGRSILAFKKRGTHRNPGRRRSGDSGDRRQVRGHASTNGLQQGRLRVARALRDNLGPGPAWKLETGRLEPRRRSPQARGPAPADREGRRLERAQKEDTIATKTPWLDKGAVSRQEFDPFTCSALEIRRRAQAKPARGVTQRLVEIGPRQGKGTFRRGARAMVAEQDGDDRPGGRKGVNRRRRFVRPQRRRDSHGGPASTAPSCRPAKRSHADVATPVWVRTYVQRTRSGVRAARIFGGIGDGPTPRARPASTGARSGFISPKAEFNPKAVETRASLSHDLSYRLRVVVDDPERDSAGGWPVMWRWTALASASKKTFWQAHPRANSVRRGRGRSSHGEMSSES